RALAIELVGAVRGLPERDHARITDEVEQLVVVVPRPAQRQERVADRISIHAASASRRRTSSSVVSEKSSYHAPTARNGAGVSAHTTSSATSAISAHASAAAVGTATTTRAGPRRRSAATAARIVAPVARPSSTRITTLPCTSGAGRSPRYSRSRRASSASSSRAMASIAAVGMPSASTIAVLRTRTPPVAIAPIASSRWNGTPSLRTRNTSSGARSSRATSWATGTPPRGSASTITSGWPAYALSRRASRPPASRRSRNRLATAAERSEPYARDCVTRPPAGRYAGGYPPRVSGTRASHRSGGRAGALRPLWPACPVRLHPDSLRGERVVFISRGDPRRSPLELPCSRGARHGRRPLELPCSRGARHGRRPLELPCSRGARHRRRRLELP